MSNAWHAAQTHTHIPARAHTHTHTCIRSAMLDNANHNELWLNTRAGQVAKAAVIERSR